MSDVMPSVPKMMAPKADGVEERLNAFLDKHVLPYPVKYLTNRVTILATMCLLIPLILFATNQVFVLAANSYLNVMSVVVSSTVLLYSTLADLQSRSAAAQREVIAKRHEEMVDKRTWEDSQKIQEIHTHLDSIDKELQQHVNSSLDNIQKILVEHLERLQGQDHKHIEETHVAIMQSMTAHHEELADLRKLIQTLTPNKN